MLPVALVLVPFGIATGYAIGSHAWVLGLGLAGFVFGLLMWATAVRVSVLTWRSHERSHGGR
jgi:hypothetical protein